MFYWIKKHDLIGIKVPERYAIFTQGDTINLAHQCLETLNRNKLSFDTYFYTVEEACEDVGV